jgi:hypothetical protein
MNRNTKERLCGLAAATAVFGAIALAGGDYNVDEDRAFCRASDDFAAVVETKTDSVLFNSEERNIHLDQKPGHCSVWNTDHFAHYVRR